MTLRLSFTEYIEALNKILLYTMVSTPFDSIDVEDGFVSYMGHLIEASNNGKRVFFIGNGGSASTASHFSADLLKTSIMKDEKRFQSLCLTDNIPVMTAWSNDTS